MKKRSVVPKDAFGRMQLLAKVNGFTLKTEQDVLRICWLADTFREVYKIGNLRKDDAVRLRCKNHWKPPGRVP